MDIIYLIAIIAPFALFEAFTGFCRDLGKKELTPR
jgi:hypothetical protein